MRLEHYGTSGRGGAKGGGQGGGAYYGLIIDYVPHLAYRIYLHFVEMIIVNAVDVDDVVDDVVDVVVDVVDVVILMSGWRRWSFHRLIIFSSDKL